MRKRWVAALVTAAVLAGCGSPVATPAGPTMLKAEGVARVQPSTDAPVGAVVRGITNLGYQLGKQGNGANWVTSPMSIAYALAMARAGANGQTAAEIDKVFGFPASGVHEAFNALTRQVVTADVPPPHQDDQTRKPGPPGPTVMCVSNALFPKVGFPISEPFLRTLAEQYGTGVYPLDFTQPSAKDAIDAWVRQQTAQRIPKAFDSVDPEAALIIVNTVYLKGDWQTPFTVDATSDGPFHRVDGSSVTVPMMAHLGRFRYAAGPGWQAVELPYGDGQLAMWILLPSANQSPNELLAPQSLAAVASGLHPATVNVAMPRWNFATNLDLKDSLPPLGLVAAFDPNRADFSGMSTVGLYIAAAVHRATITVDESGTEAAAMTALEMAPTSAGAPEAEVRADRPFAFAIVHVATGVPVFVGHVMDPSAH